MAASGSIWKQLALLEAKHTVTRIDKKTRGFFITVHLAGPYTRNRLAASHRRPAIQMPWCLAGQLSSCQAAQQSSCPAAQQAPTHPSRNERSSNFGGWAWDPLNQKPETRSQNWEPRTGNRSKALETLHCCLAARWRISNWNFCLGSLAWDLRLGR